MHASQPAIKQKKIQDMQQVYHLHKVPTQARLSDASQEGIEGCESRDTQRGEAPQSQGGVSECGDTEGLLFYDY